jgi:hypothetical protein
LLDLELTTKENKLSPPLAKDEENDSTASFLELSLLWSLSLGHETLLVAFVASPFKPVALDHPKLFMKGLLTLTPLPPRRMTG